MNFPIKRKIQIKLKNYAILNYFAFILPLTFINNFY